MALQNTKNPYGTYFSFSKKELTQNGKLVAKDADGKVFMYVPHNKPEETEDIVRLKCGEYVTMAIYRWLKS